MKIQDVSLAAGHRVCGGSEYQWQCWPDAQFMDFTDIDGQEVAGCTYSREDQTVYSAEVHLYEDDEKDSVSYRWLNPDWKQAMLDEAERRNVNSTVAYDGVTFTDIEDETEFLDLMSRIVHHTYVHAKKIVKDETIIGMSPQSGWPFPTGPKPGPATHRGRDADDTIWQELGQRKVNESVTCGGCEGCCEGCGGDESECGGGCDGCDGTCNGECDVGAEWEAHHNDDDFTDKDIDDMVEELERMTDGDKKEWQVTLTTKHRLSVSARTYEEAISKAHEFKESIRAEWPTDVCWEDHWISKETVTRRVLR
jgi:hypothetical protein